MAKLPNGQISKGKRRTADAQDVPPLGGRGRLRPEFVERVERFSDRCVSLAEELDADGRFRRIVEQVAASGTSVGADVAEADEAMSDKDFRKCLAIASKELVETRFFLRLFIRRGWIQSSLLLPLLGELTEIKLIVGTILTRTAPRRTAQARSTTG